MIKADERAPEFTLPDETGKDRSLTELSERRRHRSVLLSGRLHPGLHSPGLRVARFALGDRSAPNLRVVGISPQSPQTHAKFKAKYQLPFVLLSDEHKAVIKMYGVNGPLGLGVRRATYLIDASRRVRDVVLADFRIGRHADFVRKAIMLRATKPRSANRL